MNDKKILLVGNSFALARRLSQTAAKVYVVPGSELLSDFCQPVDIREDDVFAILSFAVKNNIDLTIVTSEISMKADIVSVFADNQMLIFGPTAQSANFALCKSFGKKFLYKLHIPTPRFGIYEKLPLALDYLYNADYPLVVRCDTNSYGKDRLCCTNFQNAKIFTEELFLRGENKVVIEEYVYGHEFTMYVVTDGYHAIPLTTVANYKFSQDGDGGLLTKGVASFAPDYKLPADIQVDFFNTVILPVLSSLQKRGNPYIGIWGVDAVLTGDDKFTVLEFKPFLQDFDAQVVLNLIDENIIELFESCANGSFADEYEDVLINDNCAVSCLVSSKIDGNVIPNIDLVDSDISFLNVVRNNYFEYISKKGDNFVLTACAKTLSRAKSYLADDLKLLNFDGMRYRKDILS